MQGYSEDKLATSTTSDDPHISLGATLARWRSNAPATASARRHDFASLSVEEDLTYRYWRRATLAFYAIFLSGIAAIAMAIGPIDKSGTAARGDVHSALVSAVQRSSR
jgi:hypothetical protein